MNIVIFKRKVFMKRRIRKKYITKYYTVPNYEEERRVRVVLPPGYNHTEERYPVVYFHDGQNMIYDKESYSGVSWKLFSAMMNLSDELRFISVLIDNAGPSRLSEYSAWDFEFRSGSVIPAGADDYLDFIVNELKADIDYEFRTLPERENTALIGSSMGGLISAYGGARYNNVFGRLGVFSLCAFLTSDQFADTLLYHPIDPNTKVYIQTGTEEGNDDDAAYNTGMNISQAYINDAITYQYILLSKGLDLNNISLNINHRETHSEFFWGIHLDECLHYLFCS